MSFRKFFGTDFEPGIEPSDFEIRVAEVLHRRHRWRWRTLTIWIVIFSFVVIVMYRSSRDLVAQNKERINDIQVSRVESCKANYNGTYKVIVSLFPPANVRTIVQAERLATLNETIAKLKSKCVKQVRTP
jgi:hypothetical protein